MARVLRTVAIDSRSSEVVELLEQASPQSWIHGAQFVTEIQGGSDTATNAVVAKPIADGLYSLSGQKWFCSNLTADYWMVTARLPDAPSDHRGIGLFCVPRLRHGRSNGYQIQRLKDKLGTRALPTAEIQLTNCVGWPVGPLHCGLKNMVATVLTTSRVYNVIASAASVRAACREGSCLYGFSPSVCKTDCGACANRILGMAARAFALVDQWTKALADPTDAMQAQYPMGPRCHQSGQGGGNLGK